VLSLAALAVMITALPMGVAAQSGYAAPAIAKPEIQPAAPGGWIWWDGSSTAGSACESFDGGILTGYCGQPGMYGTLGTIAVGNIPGSRFEAVSWTDANGHFWLFGGYGIDANGNYGPLNDLWESDTLGNAWGWMGGTSQLTSSAGQPGVYGTLGTPSTANIPGGRQAAASWTDHNGNLWLFGGYGIDANGTPAGLMNDLWKFNPNTSQWTWMSGSSTVPGVYGGQSGVYGTLGIAAAGNAPGGREAASTWVDSNGNLWLFGGVGFDGAGNESDMDDLWEFTPSNSEWTWMGGPSSAPEFSEVGVYGTLGTAASGNIPGGRKEAASWVDKNGNFWLFGGVAIDSQDEISDMNDLWEYNLTSKQWAWMGGPNEVGDCAEDTNVGCNQQGVYGTMGTAAAANIPGGRDSSVTWTDSEGNLWLFGGIGSDQTVGTDGYLNDLWKFNPSTVEWTWISGSNSIPTGKACNGTTYCGQPGVYGSIGTASAANTPGASISASSWIDESGNLWLFGGQGVDANGAGAYMNAMWEYQAQSAATPAAAAPAFTLAVGTYATTQTVTITDSTPNATIYYTTNNTTPTTNSPIYGGEPITISSTETIQAIATAPGYTQSATAIATYTITPAKTTPTVTVTPSPSSITTAQSLAVQVSVSGSGSLPTGSVTVTSGSYTSASATLVSGSATITVPAGSLGTGSDTLTASYTPDSNSSAAYNSATGSNTVTVNSSPGASNEWVWMGGSSTVPGANAGQAGVYGTLGTAAPGNIPGGRSVASTWTDSSGNLWVFGGYSTDPSGDDAAMNDLWKFNPTTNEWTWISGSDASPYFGTPAGVYGTMGTAATGNTPGGRESAATWVDKNGNLWLFGGFGANSYGIQTNYLNDLWEFNPSTSLWTWMGGAGPITYSIPAVYGTMGTAAAANLPGARQGATTWVDGNGNFWLFGGYGAASDTNGYLNDLWEFNPSTNQWTWMGGSSAFGSHCFSTQTYNLCGVPGVYGTQGTAAAGNAPGGNQYGSGWTDSSGHFWLFAGYGTDVRGNFGDLNALWEYNTSTNQWTWMGGSTNTGTDSGEIAAYGTLGTFAASNLPGARQGSASWKDSSGNFWLFGGSGFDASDAVGSLNDLWEYSPSNGDWAWMGGSNLVGTNLGQPGVYGTLGTAAAGDVPGGRQYPVSFADKGGNFWLIEGQGFDSTDTSGFLNDVWEYQSPAGATTILLPAATPTFGLPGGTYAGAQSTTITDTTPNATIYYTTNGTTPTINSTVYNGAIPLPAGGAAQTIQAFVTAPGFAPSAVATATYTVTIPVETAVATPTFTPVAGTYSSTQTVTITTTTPGATIYYTIDGSTPTTTTGLSGTGTVYLYQTGIPISSTGTVKAIATAVNYFNSAVGSATYTIAPPVASLIGNWAWMGGSSNIPDSESGQPGIYGTLGTAAAGNIPGGRDDGATWTDKNGNLWLFGGFGYDSVGTTLGILNDVWEFNPATNQWTWMGGSKTVPTCSAECGQAGVYGTLGTAAAGNIPGARDGAATWTDSSGHLWLFGGYGFDANDATGYLNDLWEFNPSTNQWTWMGGPSTLGSNCSGPVGFQTCGRAGVYGTLGTAAAGNIPGGHVGAAAWIDSSGNLWLFGGYGYDSTGNLSYQNDVWEYNTSTKQWAWMGGSSVGIGGGQPGVYGTLGTASAANIPGSRASASTWTDSSGHFWLFGGTIPAASPEYQDFNDLWEFNPATDQWTLMGGSSTIGSNCALQYTAQYPTCGQAGVYGTLGTAAAGNAPGGRSGAPSWIDNSGNLWLFGGTGMDSAGSSGLLDDLWSFSPTTKQWTWMGGSNVIGSDCLYGPNDNCGMPGIYGTLGSPAVENIPGSRDSTSHWTDSSGHFWLFGGVGLDANGSHIGYLNDMWEYQPSATTVTTPTAATPTFSEQGGSYSSTQSVTISDTTPNAIIYYTTNGNSPTTSSAVYGGTAITVSSTETIEAIATANGYTQSAAATATYTITAATTPTVTVTPSPASITTAQGLSVTITVSGTPTPTGSVVLTSGSYTSSAIILSSGSVTIAIPAGSLSKGTDTLMATYTPDSSSSSTYTGAMGSNTVTVSSPALITPTVVVTPGSSSITSAQPLTVTVAVSGGNGNPTPTGALTLTSGTYTSGPVTLSSGSATINIPAGSLGNGTDTLIATYTPDSSSSSTYNSATGTNTVNVAAAITTIAPTVTVTPASSTITSAQSLSVTITLGGTQCAADRRTPTRLIGRPAACGDGITPTGSVILTSGSYTSAAATLSSGSATIVIPAGALAAGTDTLTATYTPDSNSSSTYTSATGTSTVTVTAVVIPAPVASLTPASLAFTALSGATSAAQIVTLTNTGNAALSITGVAISGTGAADFVQTNSCGSSLAAGASCTVSVTFTPASAASFSASLTVTDNAAASPQSVTLSGTGTPLPSFTLASGAPSGTASQSTPVTFTITVTPQNGSFAAPVTFSTSGLPAGYTATFSPPTVTPGSSPASTTMTIQSSPITVSRVMPLAAPVLAFLGFCFLPGKRRRRLLALCLLVVASFGGIATLTGCGGGFALINPGQTYTVTITASGGGQTQTTTVLLTVQE
jgi:N-acetylneuraminic acid mutarotase